MKLLEDFISKYGNDLCEIIIERAGIHNSLGSNAPSGKTERLAFGLLEIIDFECNKYGDFEGINDEEIKSFLKTHKNEVNQLEIEPPSYLGLLCGVLNFLEE